MPPKKKSTKRKTPKKKSRKRPSTNRTSTNYKTKRIKGYNNSFSPPYLYTTPGYSDITSQLPCGTMPGYEQFTCMNLPLADIKYIIGPCSFHYFKYAGRNIYLFGEAHLPIARSSELMMKTDKE